MIDTEVMRAVPSFTTDVLTMLLPMAHLATIGFIVVIFLCILVLLFFKHKAVQHSDGQRKFSVPSYVKEALQEIPEDNATSNVISLAAAREIRALRDEGNRNSLSFNNIGVKGDGPEAA